MKTNQLEANFYSFDKSILPKLTTVSTKDSARPEELSAGFILLSPDS